jgi:hypothetical protein
MQHYINIVLVGKTLSKEIFNFNNMHSMVERNIQRFLKKMNKNYLIRLKESDGYGVVVAEGSLQQALLRSGVGVTRSSGPMSASWGPEEGGVGGGELGAGCCS